MIATGISKENLKLFFSGILNSYSQIFFSTYKPFAIIILVVTFYDVYAGISGLLSVTVTTSVAFILNLHKPTTSQGFYGFNSLLVGLGLGIYFSFGWELILIVFLASILTFLFSVSLQGVIGKYQLPYLSIPFILTLWIFLSATKSFDALGISERGIYTLNELYQIGGDKLISVHEYFNSIHFPKYISTFFISLSAILFQYSILTGMIIAFGILLYSRIAFSLSILGFSIAFIFYMIIGAQITEIDYSYIGFNYILTSIALGGFFLIPSVRSYLWVIILIPLVAILTIGLNTIFLEIKLPIYSLPFNIIVLLFIYILKFRTEYSPKLAEVYYQYNSPEKNLYIFLNNAERFRFSHLTQVKLPFFGTWDISQGHNGTYTHKEQWRHAWDFVICDKDGTQFKKDGDYPEDYYCFGKPVIAPEEGVVEKVVNDINDNTVGEVNLKNNWGNTVIIKHADNVYTKLSHLKEGSVKVNEGDKVTYGQIIGQCGNSGRSPYPHLHFQIQQFPFIGSSTIDYPISNYVLHNHGFELMTYKTPKENEKVSNIETNELLSKGFQFTPGQILKFKVNGFQGITEVEWEVQVNAYNESFIKCKNSGAMAYFTQDENLFHFTYFEGSKKCLLYYFSLGAYKIQKGFYQDMTLSDHYPLSLGFPKSILWIHDFISPFVRIVKSVFTLNYSKIDDYMSPSEIVLYANLENYILKKSLGKLAFEITINTEGVSKFVVNKGESQYILERCEE